MQTNERETIMKLVKLNPPSSVIHGLFNGAIVTTLDGQFTYKDGMLAGAGGVSNLVPSRITAITWPEPAAAPAAKPVSSKVTATKSKSSGSK
jgi:hypothetical protein